MTENEYNQRKWELFHQWQNAFPVFPKVGINRKQKLIRLIAEYNNISKEAARAKAEGMNSMYKQ